MSLFLIAGAQQESTNDSIKITGTVLNSNTQEPLPYANISVADSYTGVVSNEKGQFSFRNEHISSNDTIVFQYIGYHSKKVPAIELVSNPVVLLDEEIINLSELLVFGNTLNARKIVKNVLVYKDSNYYNTTNITKAFVRERDITNLVRMELNTKRSNIPGIDSDLIELIEENIPKQSFSYIDFLGDIYFNGLDDDSVKIKTKPIRTVSLKEKDIAELDRIEEIFEGVVKDTKEDEYWKVKTGIFSQKIDMDDPEPDSSTVSVDTTPDNFRKIRYFNYRIKNWIGFTSFDNDDQWEFLHKTSRYDYTLIGGTRVNGEDVYIIDFEPKENGLFTGRLYIARNKYALIRADYEYAPYKYGRDINLLGFGYTETQFKGSIYFEKKDNRYKLKYFSHKIGSSASIDRSFSFLKKRKRFLFDKKVNEIKVAFDFFIKNEESVELLVLDNKELTQDEFYSFKQEEQMEIIYVDQFDDNLWKGYSIIEPTQKMKDYKKQELNFIK